LFIWDLGGFRKIITVIIIIINIIIRISDMLNKVPAAASYNASYLTLKNKLDANRLKTAVPNASNITCCFVLVNICFKITSSNYKIKLAPCRTDGRLFTTDISAKFKVM